MGYPGYYGYPWSRYSHGTDPSYEDWQGPGFGTSAPGSWEPLVETFRRDENLVVRVELPGWDKDEVDVFVEDDELVIEGRREDREDDDRVIEGRREESRIRRDEESRVRRGEEPRSRSYTAEHFSTRISIPRLVDPDKMKARFKNGVLEVRIPMPDRNADRRKVKIDT